MKTIVLHFISTLICAADRVMFESVPAFVKSNLLGYYKQGSPFTCSRIDECANRCIVDIMCSQFKYKRQEGTCQLFGDVPTSDDQDTADPKDSIYYYSAGRCLPGRGYMLRESNMCVAVHTELVTYPEAVARCQAWGGRTVVLEDDLQTNVVLNLLEKLGLDKSVLYVGATRESPDPFFVWNDGRNVTFGWGPWEPHGELRNETCVVVRSRKLHDVTCLGRFSYICEILA